MTKRIITISREFGSGGRTIAKQVADRLGIPCYDKELIAKIAEESGYQEEFVQKGVEEAPTKSRFVYNFMGRDIQGMSASDYLWKAQCKVIYELADQGPCVIVGRCADYLLREWKDCLTVFIHADVQKRAKRIVELYGETGETPQRRLREKDRKRSIHYNYYTDQEWGMAQNYHISLDSGELGIEKCVDIICELAR